MTLHQQGYLCCALENLTLGYSVDLLARKITDKHIDLFMLPLKMMQQLPMESQKLASDILDDFS